LRAAGGAGGPDAPRSSAPRTSPARRSGGRGRVDASRPELATRLDAGIEALGLGPKLDSAARRALLDYVELIARWNRSFNLTAIRDPRAMVAAHLADSLSLVPLLDDVPDGSILVDVGSGAGLPGIPLHIARPGLRVELVEPVGKKAAFLRQCRAELGLDGLGVHEARVEDLSLDAEPAVVTSRAFASLADFAASVAGVAGTRTRLLAMKGARPDAEIAEFARRGLPWRIGRIETLVVPGLDAQRCVVVLETLLIPPASNPTEP